MIASLMPSVLTIACPSSAEDPRTDRNGRFYFAQKKLLTDTPIYAIMITIRGGTGRTLGPTADLPFFKMYGSDDTTCVQVVRTKVFSKKLKNLQKTY